VIQTEHPHLVVAALSHPGETGKNNEDRYSVTAYQLESEGTPALLAVVADGIGGHLAGEVAADLTTETIVKSLAASSGLEPIPQLRSAVKEAARAVSRAAQETPDYGGMGSTVAVAWIIGARLYVASIGDSRIYLIRRGRLRQITTDHTWVYEAIRHNIISPEEAQGHPNAHVLLRHIGGDQIPEPDMRFRLSPNDSDSRAIANQGFRLRSGDKLLLCSDGLTDLVEDSEIREALLGHPPDEAVSHLVDLARSRGGYDNITAVLLAVPTRPKAESRRARIRLLRAGGLGAVGLIVVIVSALAAVWWMGGWPWSPPTPAPQPTAASASLGITPGAAHLEGASPSATPTPSPTPVPQPTATHTPIPLPTVPSPTP
jgi:protein phosphatase